MGRFHMILIAAIVLTVVHLLVSSKEASTYRYVELTDGSITPYSMAYCRYGVLLNNDGGNIFGPDSKVITCKGYIELTKEQAKQYEKFI